MAAAARRRAEPKPLFHMSRVPWEKIFAFTSADLVKLLVSAAIIVLVTRIQFFSDRLSALPVALPITSLIAMIWMQQAGQSAERIANHAESTFWFVLPSLPMFLLLPWMLRHGWGFWVALATNCVLTVGFFWVMVALLRRFGLDLMAK